MPSLSPVSQPVATIRHSGQRLRLSNGITLLVAQNPTVDIVAARLFFRGGSRVEAPTQAGLANLMAAVLTKGTQTRDSQAVAAAIESLGAGIGAESAPDYFEVSLKCVSADFSATFTLLGEILRQPSFPSEEVEREQAMLLQAIRSQQERAFTVAFDQLRLALYGDHPYANSTLGQVESVAGLTRADVVTYHANYFRPDQLVIAVVGPLSPQQVQAEIEAVLGDWLPPTVGPADVNLGIPFLAHPLTLTTEQETQQSTVMVGYLGAGASSPDYAALKLLSTYLGNGLSSRLFVELREKRGLAYEVSAFYATRLDPSPFAAYLGTAAENTATALAGLQAELQRLRDQPLTLAEVELAKRKLLGQYALGKQTNAQIAQLMGWYEVLGLGMEFDLSYPQAIQKVTPEHLFEVVQQYLAIPVISLVGPAEALASVA